MAILGGRWRSLAHRHEAAVAEARAGQDEERAAAFERIAGLAEQWPEWTPGPEAVAQ